MSSNFSAYTSGIPRQGLPKTGEFREKGSPEFTLSSEHIKYDKIWVDLSYGLLFYDGASSEFMLLVWQIFLA